MDAPLYANIADAPEGGRAYYLTTRDDVRIRVGVWPVGRKGTVLIFTGRTEYIEKYGPVVGQLKALGWSSVVIDWRGQGLSKRVHDTTAVGHVWDFDEYQTDIDTVLGFPAVSVLPKPTVMLGHSMGGAIGLRALHSRLPVAGAIFSAPMWGFGVSPLTRWVGSHLACTLTALGQGTALAPGAESESYVLTTRFEDNKLTTSSDTYARLQNCVRTHADLGLGGISNAWFHAAHQETEALMAKLSAPIPTLTFFGSDEEIVCADTIRQYHAKPGSGRLFRIDGAKHEILMEDQPKLDQAWAQIAPFLEEIAG